MATTLESYFAPFRRQIVGIDQEFDSPYGRKKVVYADWTASGRLFGPIEERLLYELGPFVGNTHTETTITGSAMTQAYHESLAIIKKHVNANASDVILTCESGMTGAVNKLQRILGFRVHENFVDQIHIPHQERPVVFITHMEHHSNHTSWLETVAEVICIEPTEAGMVDLEDFKFKLAQYQDRKVKIAAVSAASNVTGIIPPYYEIARIIHQNGGLCFVDFACSGPYVQIDMHPAGDPLAKLDAIYFSPHKFLGGPGTPGIVIFDSKLYNNRVPDQPGGGTVSYTSPWGDHRYLLDIEVREDGGTPPFLQTIKAAMAMRLKEEMGVENILNREKEILKPLWEAMLDIPNLHILADQHPERLGILSFYIEDLHFNLAVRLLNDRFGIQVRGGCSCAGTYGHYLLHINRSTSEQLLDEIQKGNLFLKPGWVRLSVHPVITDEEVQYMIHALRELAAHHQQWAEDYEYVPSLNEYRHHSDKEETMPMVRSWLGEAFGEKQRELKIGQSNPT
jgi:selenocysteine lyase/cysteine desulfurase